MCYCFCSFYDFNAFTQICFTIVCQCVILHGKEDLCMPLGAYFAVSVKLLVRIFPDCTRESAVDGYHAALCGGCPQKAAAQNFWQLYMNDVSDYLCRGDLSSSRNSYSYKCNRMRWRHACDAMGGALPRLHSAHDCWDDLQAFHSHVQKEVEVRTPDNSIGHGVGIIV